MKRCSFPRPREAKKDETNIDIFILGKLLGTSGIS